MTPGERLLPDTGPLETEDAKDHLRRHLRQHRRTTHPHPEQGHEHSCEVLTEHALQAVAGASTVAAYVSVGSEPCTRLLLPRLHQAGVRVLLPVLGPSLSRSWGWYAGDEDLADRSPGRPPEPSGSPLPPETLQQAEAVLVPALAVDGAGHRLGQGGGWYDRMLPLASPDALVFALLHPDELVGTPLPAVAHDRDVDAVVTSESWFLLRGSAFATTHG